MPSIAAAQIKILAQTGAALLVCAFALAATGPIHPTVSVLFSPHGGCTARLVGEIDAARKSIRVQSYTFTSRPIADALLRARARGLDVQVILDDGANGKNPLGPEWIAKGVPVAYDAAHAIAHNKLIIIDGLTVLGGSFNHSAAAEASNAENLTIIVDPAIATTYIANWTAHRNHSGPHVQKFGASIPATMPEF